MAITIVKKRRGVHWKLNGSSACLLGLRSNAFALVQTNPVQRSEYSLLGEKLCIYGFLPVQEKSKFLQTPASKKVTTAKRHKLLLLLKILFLFKKVRKIMISFKRVTDFWEIKNYKNKKLPCVFLNPWHRNLLRLSVDLIFEVLIGPI